MNEHTTGTATFLSAHSAGLTPKQARLYGNFTLRTAAARTEPEWSSSEARDRWYEALWIASAALSAHHSGADLPARTGFQRAAEMFEWLTPEFDGPETALLACALYQLAGLPAMAKSVSISLDSRDNPHAAFVASDFAAFEVAARAASSLFGMDLEPDDERDEETLIARQFLSALNIVVSSIRWGDHRVEQALDMLRDVAAFFAASRDELAWLLASVFELIAREYVATSLRSAAQEMKRSLSVSGSDFIERYVRVAYASGRALAWPTQRIGIERLVRGGGFALCTPTGSGKTTIAELAIVQALYAGDGELSEVGFGRLALYIVPSRSLAAEVERRLSRTFTREGSEEVRIVLSYGGSDVSSSESDLFSQRPTVLVCTQEKADSLIRASGEFFVNRLTGYGIKCERRHKSHA